MPINSKSVAFLISLIVSVLTTTVLSLLPDVSKLSLILAFITCFLACGGLVYFMFELLIFKEVKLIYADLEKIKKKEFKTAPKTNNLATTPLKKIKDELYLLEARKQKELEELKKLDAFRREFLADVSHELKTPVFAAQGFIHTLLDGAIDDPTVRDPFLQKAARSLDRLDQLIQDLLNISQIEKGMLKMHKVNFNIIKMTYEVFEQLEQKASEKNIQLHLHENGYAKLDVHADPARIRQVLTNLVDNAIKYGHTNGNIWVSFLLGKSKVSISIRDDGEGIAPKHQSRIFERFYRIDKSRSRNSGGTGLGLAIAKHIIEAHKARLFLRSSLGHGTTIKFKLPKAYISRPQLPNPKP